MRGTGAGGGGEGDAAAAVACFFWGGFEGVVSDMFFFCLSVGFCLCIIIATECCGREREEGWNSSVSCHVVIIQDRGRADELVVVVYSRTPYISSIFLSEDYYSVIFMRVSIGLVSNGLIALQL